MATLDLSALDSAVAAFTATDGVAARAPLAQFEEDPANPRTEFDGPAFDELVQDVTARGILQPIVVRRTDGGRLRIRFGARRYRAAVAAGLPDAPYVVTEDERQFDDYAQVAENERRAPLQPLELATFIARKVAQGEAKKDIAARLQIPPSTLTYHLALIDMPSLLSEIYRAHRCRSPQLLYQLRRMYEQQPDLVARRCADAVGIDVAFVASLTAEVKGPKPGGTSPPPSEPGPTTAPPDDAGASDIVAAARATNTDGSSAAGMDGDDGVTSRATAKTTTPEPKTRPGPTPGQIRDALREIADAYEAAVLGGQPSETKAAAKRRLTYVRALLSGINPG